MFRMSSRALLAGVVIAIAGCASAPPAPPAPVVTWEQKLGWILSLEDRRLLADPSLAPAAVVAPGAPRQGAAAAPFIAEPDLLVLVRDPEPRVRHRAALAIGRVGLSDGVPALVALLEDAEPDVRGIAAFAIGLVGDTDGVAPLVAALADDAPLVRGRAAEGLGLVCETARGESPTCDDTVAPAIAGMAEGYIAAAGAMTGDEQTASSPEADAWRLAAFALVRMRDWPALARITIDASGRPVTSWWPVAYALQRVGDAAGVEPRAALRALAASDAVTTAAFAMRALGDHRDETARATLTEAARNAVADVRVRIAAVRALARLQAGPSVSTLLEVLQAPNLDDNLRLEIVTALGALGDARAVPMLLDLMADPWPLVRAAALEGVARLDPDSFTLVLSGLLPDADWRVRAALAGTLATLPREIAAPRLEELWKDEDRRVHGAALSAAVTAKLPEAEAWIREGLTSDDAGARAAAASALGRMQPAWGVDALREAYDEWAIEPDYGPRAAALGALARYGLEAARESLTRALEDREWAMRVRARALLESLGADPIAPEAIRPVPNPWPSATFADAALIAPPYSPQVYLETTHGTIQIELDVINAPLTSWNFLELARRGFYYGVTFHRVVPNFVVQAGDPRGDGEGGSTRTIRDEFNTRPYVRGTVGMALSWADTGSSQFFITHGPSPHLDGRYTVFGRVVSGMEAVDRIRQGDAILAVRVVTGS